MFMELRFIGINVWLGGLLMDNIIEFLQHHKPDVVAMQEVYESDHPLLGRRFKTIEVLKEATGLEYHHYAPAMNQHHDLCGVPSGNAILSRYPIVSSNVEFYDIPYNGERDAYIGRADVQPRNLQHVVLDTPAGEINVFNTQGVWGEHGDDTDRRLAMAKQISAAVHGKPKTILTGDFNVNEGTESIAMIGRELQNIFEGERVTSFNMKWKPQPSGYGEAVVDMIFVSDDITLLHKECPNPDVSDHLPVVAYVEV